MSELTSFTVFKRGVIKDLKALDKKINYIDIKKIEIVKEKLGFAITIYLSKNVPDLDGAIAKIIYRHKPILSLTLGDIRTVITNDFGKKTEINFNRMLYIEDEIDNGK